MTRAIVVAFHKYTPFGGEYYKPLFDYFIGQMGKYKNEFNKLYLLDSTWGFTIEDAEKMSKLGLECQIENVDPHLRYYDAYRQIIPIVKEDLILSLDNDFLIYKKGVINSAMKYDVVSIVDTIGTMKVPLKKGNKLCPYFFATRKDLLMKYLNIDWGPNMPYTETFGLLTEALLKDGAKVYEMEDDKSNFLFGEELGERRSKNLGYYHVRSGSTPAYLLSHRERGDKQYWDYLKNQPKSEYLRQCAWYSYMGGDPRPIYHDCGIYEQEWQEYMKKFREYHGL